MFSYKGSWSLEDFLGIEGMGIDSWLFPNQWKYTLDIFYGCGILGSQPFAFPMEQQHKLSDAFGLPLSDLETYYRLVRCLIHLTITRPNMCYSVHIHHNSCTTYIRINGMLQYESSDISDKPLPMAYSSCILPYN